jgi:6-phosphogluconolactonase/glucosamine-6-phosphate isomerase/deaminase
VTIAGALTLAKARWKALLISGEQKRETLTHALQSADPTRYPVRLLFEGETSPRVYYAE